MENPYNAVGTASIVADIVIEKQVVLIELPIFGSLIYVQKKERGNVKCFIKG
jgi:hypothetical protein